MPEIELRLFKMTNAERQSGIAINNYKGSISLIAAKQNGAGQIWGDWCYPQRRVDGQSVPSEKVMPMKIELGNGKAEALATLRHFIRIIEGGVEKEAPPPDDDIPPF